MSHRFCLTWSHDRDKSVTVSFRDWVVVFRSSMAFDQYCK